MLLRPEPRDDQVFVLARWKVNKTVDATANAKGSARMQMVNEELRGIASLGGLLRREEPLLGDGRLEQAVPVRAIWAHTLHAQNVSITLVLCKSLGLALIRSLSLALVSCGLGRQIARH